MATPNSTCEVCWCIVLDKYRSQHEQYHEELGNAPEVWRW